jgi:hypothetical protein
MNILVSILVAGLLLAAALVLARALPAQNVALILGCLIAWEMALEWAWPGLGSHWDGWLFWPAMSVLARTGGRWFLRRRRQDWNYGVWLLVLAGAVAALAQWGLALRGATWIAACRLSAIRFASTVFCLFWLSPWFVSKHPRQSRP